MPITVFIASVFSGLVRGSVMCWLLFKTLSPRFGKVKTWALYMTGELAFDLIHEIINGPYDNIALTFLFYYIILTPAMMLLLFKGSVLTRLSRGGLCLLLFFSAGMLVGLTTPLFPERVQYVVFRTYFFLHSFSVDYFIVLFWLAYSGVVETVFSSILLRLFLTLQNRSELPNTARFMLIPLTQSILPGMLYVLYYVPEGYTNRAAFPIYVFGMLLICIFCDTLLFILVRRMDIQAQQSRRLKLMEQEQQAFYKRYSAINSLYRRERIFHHDINNQLTAVDALYASGNKEEAIGLLDSVSSRVSHFSVKEGAQ